jgi:hypothetical protein
MYNQPAQIIEAISTPKATSSFVRECGRVRAYHAIVIPIINGRLEI